MRAHLRPALVQEEAFQGLRVGEHAARLRHRDRPGGSAPPPASEVTESFLSETQLQLQTEKRKKKKLDHKRMTARGEEGGGLGRVAFGAVGGAMADVVPRLVTYPLETLKSRSIVTPILNKQLLNKDPAAQLPKPRLAWRETLSRTYQTLGLWRGFFPGVHVALLGTIPGSAAYFFGYEVGKMATAGHSPAVQGAASGVAAQLIANVFHTPIDNVKERAQVQESVVRAGGQKRVYSTSELVRRVVREEGK